MRKLSLVVMMLASASLLSAQKSKVTSAANYLNTGKLDKAKEAIDLGITHVKCVKWPKAYLVKGKVYQGIFETPLDAYKKLSEEPLNIAFDSYNKVIEVDVKGKYKKQLKTQFKNLILDFTNHAVGKFNESDYSGALTCFEKILEIEEIDFMKTGVADTIIIFNAALSAEKSKNFDKAIKYYNQSIDLSYDAAKCYVGISNSYKGLDKKDEAIKALHKGFESFPDDTVMLFELINYYLLGGEPEKAEQYLDKAIELDPKNGSLYRAKGSLFDKLKNEEKAAEMFTKALELTPDDYLSQYNLGNIYLKKAINLHQEVNEIMDAKKYNEGMVEVFKQYKEAIPYFEKVLVLKSDEKNSLIVLKELYFKLRNENEEYLNKYNDTKAKLEKL